MRKKLGFKKVSPSFKRHNLQLNGAQPVSAETALKPAPTCTPRNNKERFSVLVINATNEMAREITMQLTLQIPGCAILFAPTLSLATLMLRRRSVDLVVSSPLLPDGGIKALQKALCTLRDPPDVVILGDRDFESVNFFNSDHYQFVSVRTVAPEEEAHSPVSVRPAPATLNKKIETLGSDIRNDLNNPLQEIVSLVFVARAGAASSETTEMALGAIEKAAKNMADVVWGLEEKINDVVNAPTKLRSL